MRFVAERCVIFGLAFAFDGRKHDSGTDQSDNGIHPPAAGELLGWHGRIEG
jgi:hypothetical protein